MNVEEVMTPDPVTVSVDTYATKVRSILRDENFRTVPVVSGTRLEGMISRGDMLNITATKSNVDARGIMEHPKFIATLDMDIEKVAKNLIDADIVQAPVIKPEGEMQLVGIISVVDILEKLVNNNIKPKNKTLGEIATKNVVTCNYDDHVSKVWNKMNDTGFSGLPVLKKNKIIGIITRKNIINSGHARIVKESNEIKGSTKVESLMKTPPIVATMDMEIKEAAKIMIEEDIGRLPIIENPRHVKKEPNMVREADLVGIVAREDMLGSYLN